jgi:signal transduction histidine kinase
MTSSAPPPARLPRFASLRGRLLRAVAIITTSLVVVCALATIALDRLGGAIGLILKENYVSVVACQEMNEALERQDSAALFAATGHEEIATPMFATHRPAFDAAFAKEAANITLPGEGDLVSHIDAHYREYIQTVDRVLAAPPETRVDGYFRELLPRFHAVKDEVTQVRLLNQRNMEWADGQARRISRRTLQIAIAVTAAALVLVVWLLRRIPKTVLEPLATFTERARAIGEGRLDAQVPIPEVSELRVLAESLNRMQEKLRAYRESSLGELLAAKDLSRATIAAMAEPVIVFSARGEVLLSNESAEKIFGVTPGDPDELRQAGVEVPDPIAVARDTVLTHGEPLHPQSLADAMRWITPEGERYFLVRASPLSTEEAGGAAAIVVAQDVTRFRRIDALKSDVVATVSHELKTPLTGLRLSTHMLLEDSTGPLTATQRELAETARDETERLQATVDELLDLVRIEREAGALKRGPVDPSLLLREVAKAHEKVARAKGVSIALDVTEAPKTIDVDAEQIAIVVGNLLANAVRHSKGGGTVTVSARSDGGDAVLAVRDEGEGIAADHLERIFDRHWSGADPATLKGRHGLGLAIAKDIVVRHGGRLEVESTPGKGSTFRLRVPQQPRVAEAS